MDALMNTVGWPALAALVTWWIASKIGKAKYTSLAEKAHGVIAYAQRNLSKLDDLVIDAADDFEDGKLDSGELKSKIRKAKALAQSLKNTNTIDTAEAELRVKARK